MVFLLGELACLTRSGTFRRETKLSPTAEVVRIVEMVSPGAYRIQTPPGSRMHDVVSIEHLGKYTPRNPEEEPGMAAEPVEQRPVRRICGERCISDVTEFLVAFKDEEDPEWVEEMDCRGMEKFVKEFYERRIARKDRERVDGAFEDVVTRPLLIDGIEAAVEMTEREGPRRSGRQRKQKRFFDDP